MAVERDTRGRGDGASGHALGGASTTPSILFDGLPPDAALAAVEQPDCFTDLGLDQIVDGIVAGRDAYDLRPFFLLSAGDVRTVRYRQEVFQDLERPDVFQAVDAFGSRMRAMRQHRQQAERVLYPLQRQACWLESAERYCTAIRELASGLRHVQLGARALRSLRQQIVDYAQGQAFRMLSAEVAACRRGLAGVHYCVLIRGNRVRVSRYAGEEDYSEEAARAFERFREGPVRAHLATFSTSAEMSHVEARILDLVAKLYPDVFAALRAFCDRHRSFVDPAIDRFDREIQFYLAYLDHLAPMARAGLEFSRPVVSDQVKEVQANRTFDLALAAKRVGERRPVVTNDFFLRGGERMIVVTGPNQGGKTTFARTFGQLHHLASLGCPVPGKDTRLFLPDRILTHFEREEDAESGSGKLESDLLRMQAIFGMATPRSIVILNEMFTSTTVEDALRLSREMLRRLVDLDLLCVCVTFLDELSSLGPSTVSMVSTVRPDDPAERTFKVVRQPANGLAYAIAIAERHAVTYSAVRRRLRR